jgi:endonuclease/exonuclease/phosphatase family metal-dependent hydrolase
VLLPEFYFHFQAAMSYPEQVWHRVEEGTAVFSRYPIVDVGYTLLTRDFSRSEDEHQRAVLRVTISTPQLGHFHVFVSHFALE